MYEYVFFFCNFFVRFDTHLFSFAKPYFVASRATCTRLISKRNEMNIWTSSELHRRENSWGSWGGWRWSRRSKGVRSARPLCLCGSSPWDTEPLIKPTSHLRFSCLLLLLSLHAPHTEMQPEAAYPIKCEVWLGLPMTLEVIEDCCSQMWCTCVSQLATLIVVTATVPVVLAALQIFSDSSWNFVIDWGANLLRGWGENEDMWTSPDSWRACLWLSIICVTAPHGENATCQNERLALAWG